MQVLKPATCEARKDKPGIVPVKFVGLPFTPPPPPADNMWRLGEVNGWVRTGKFLKQGRHSRPELVYRVDDPSMTEFVLKRRFENRAPGASPRRLPPVESAVLSRLSHPNVIFMVESGYDSLEYEYVILPYLNGSPLTRTQNTPLQRALYLFRGACRGLAHIHQQGIIHGDLALCNVFICMHGETVLIDFAGSYFREGDIIHDKRREHGPSREWTPFARRDIERLGNTLAALLGRRAIHRPRVPTDWESVSEIPQFVRESLKELSSMFKQAKEIDIDLSKVEEQTTAMLMELALQDPHSDGGIP